MISSVTPEKQDEKTKNKKQKKACRKCHAGSCMCPIEDGNDVVYSVGSLCIVSVTRGGGERGMRWDEGELQEAGCMLSRRGFVLRLP